jgi:hypothetical protein
MYIMHFNHILPPLLSFLVPLPFSAVKSFCILNLGSTYERKHTIFVFLSVAYF